jgi:hypothetical protein
MALEFLCTWIDSGLGLGGLGLDVGIGIPQPPQSPGASVSVSHVQHTITSSASSVCSSFSP